MTTVGSRQGGFDSRQSLFGLEIDAMTMAEVLERAHLAVQERRRLLIGVVNAAKVVKMRKDELLRNSLLAADVLLADGQSIVWASRILGHPLPERVAGIDLFERLLESANLNSASVYFLGARPNVLDALLEQVGARFPDLRVAGSRDGYFSAEQSSEVAEAIAASNADMLFLGMTSPKKEIFLASFGDTLNVPLLHGVGGSFDILAGVTRRAPRTWQRLGIEWAFRLLQEPRRLLSRYLSTNTAFIALTLRERIHPTASYAGVSATRRTHRAPEQPSSPEHGERQGTQ
ncbi:WecB/TagA/CpsF family glycosyltransferase [Cryobacterium mannosilyticum]|nr:WecB/TagA/CpsF family glycosyltransferase [Cryobacterium mannosilyticum]